MPRLLIRFEAKARAGVSQSPWWKVSTSDEPSAATGMGIIIVASHRICQRVRAKLHSLARHPSLALSKRGVMGSCIQYMEPDRGTPATSVGHEKEKLELRFHGPESQPERGIARKSRTVLFESGGGVALHPLDLSSARTCYSVLDLQQKAKVLGISIVRGVV